MNALLDSSVLVAALASDELKHSECLARLLKVRQKKPTPP
jgi:predicted nucleic acid-binding protein